MAEEKSTEMWHRDHNSKKLKFHTNTALLYSNWK